MINTDALARALELANAEPKPWRKDPGKPSMVDWHAYAHRVAVLYEQQNPSGPLFVSSGGTQVEGQTTFGQGPEADERNERLASEEDLVAFGNEPEFGPEYHPRTGQKLSPLEYLRKQEAKPFRHTDGGPSLKEYLESKGEM